MPNITEFLKEWASTLYGLVISDEKIDFQIHRLIKSQGLNEKSYMQALKANNSNIVNATLDVFTVQESYFFRDVSLFLYLKNILLPNLIKAKQQTGDLKLTIWSAGCARGEEIYSIAIYLDQLLPDIKKWEINLIATDINEFALDGARQGIFTPSSMRATDKAIIAEYFESSIAPYVLKSRIRKMVKFMYGNIIDHAMAVIYNKKIDLIFCRNVFIYLNQETIESALNNFYDSLVDGGILFLGPSDLITYYQHNFSVEMTNNIFQLRKTIKKTASEPSVVISPTPIPKKKPFTYAQQLQERSSQLKLIRIALDNKNYRKALEKINRYLSIFPETALLYRYKGEALIGLGDTATSISYLKQSIKLDSLDAVSHFLHALAVLDMKNNTAAMDSLQKALYIKNNFPEAAYHLGLIYLQNRQWENGMKLLKQSLIYAEQQPKEKATLCADGTMEQLIKAISASISYYQGQNHE